MFCPQCGAKAEASVKFCRACGLNLSEYARSLTTLLSEPERESREQAEEEIRQMKGVRALAAAYFTSLLTILLFAWAHWNLHGPDGEIAGLFILALVILSVLLAGWGTYTLWRSKFFKTRKERLINGYALILEQSRK